MNYQTQIKLELVFWGEGFNPDEFTSLIGLIPTSTSKKDDFLSDPKDRRKDSLWGYSSGFIASVFLDEIFMSFISPFEEKIDLIKGYTQRHNIEAKIYVVVEIFDGALPALYFNKEMLRFAHEMDLVIDIDMYLLNAES